MIAENELKALKIISETGKIMLKNLVDAKESFEIEKRIIDATSFLFGEGITLRERVLCIQSEVTEQRVCSECGSPLRSTRKEGKIIMYAARCSVKCSANSSKTIEKRERTCVERYGVKNPYQSKDKKIKIRETNLSRRGVENPSFSKESRQKRINRCVERYGVEHWTQIKMPRKSLEKLADRDWLYDQYVTKRIPALHIAKDLGILGHKTVCRYLEKYGIPIRHDGWYSQKAIRWINWISKQNNVYIQHAENDGEYWIPGLRFFVDGYCEETNTVYEFYGDAFHGNPARYELEDRPHPYEKNKTTKELFEKTMSREKILREAGFQVIVIWESDWDASQKRGLKSPL